MPVDASDLLGLLNSTQLFPSCWAGVAPCRMDTFANWASRGEALCSLLRAILGLMQFSTIAACLGCVALSVDVTVIVGSIALFCRHGRRASIDESGLPMPFRHI